MATPDDKSPLESDKTAAAQKGTSRAQPDALGGQQSIHTKQLHISGVRPTTRRKHPYTSKVQRNTFEKRSNTSRGKQKKTQPTKLCDL